MNATASPVISGGLCWRALLRGAGVAVVYFLAAKLGLHYGLASGNISPVWPASGVGLTALLMWGPAMALPVFLGNAVAVWSTEASAMGVVGSGLAGTLEALAAWGLLRVAIGQRLPFYRVLDVLRFVALAGVLATGVAALVGVAAMTLGGEAPPEAFTSLWMGWWIGDMMGVLWVAPPLLMLLTRREQQWKPRQAGHAVAITLLIVALSGLVFGEPWVGLSGYTNPLTFLIVPLIVWATFVFQQHGAAFSTLLAGSLAILGSGEGYGPFAGGDVQETLFLLQTYLATSAVSAMLLAAVLTEYHGTRLSLQQLNEELEERVQERTRELEFLNQQRASFYSLVSHDLKGLVTSFVGYAGLMTLDDAMPAEELRDMGRRAHDVGRRLAYVLEGLFQWSLLQLDRLTIQPERLPLAVVLTEAAQFFAAAAERKGVRIVCEPTDLSARADQSLTESVLRNLVSNALKFTPRGGTVTLRATAAPNGDGRPSVRVEVADTGVGMSEEQLERLFRVESKKSQPGTDGESGTGMGLVLSRELVQYQGGTLTASSEAGAGTVMAITLPAAQD